MSLKTLKNVALLTGVVLSLSTVLSPAHAQEKAKRDPGKKIFMTKACMACHGKDGRKAIFDYPNLAGQDEKYMIYQINDIINGKRLGSPDATGSPRSQGMRGALIRVVDNKPSVSPEDIKNVAHWLSQQEPAEVKAPATPLDAASVEAGAALFKKKCKSCHGAEGNKPLRGYPYLAGQKRNYLFAQLQDIKSKARKTSRTGAMYGIVKRLTDDQFANLADYLSQVDRTAKK
jgi:cytochrome c553